MSLSGLLNGLALIVLALVVLGYLTVGFAWVTLVLAVVALVASFTGRDTRVGGRRVVG